MVIKNLFETLTNKKLAIFGFSFKASTNDTRESQVLIFQKFIARRCKLNFMILKLEKDILIEFDEIIKENNVLISDNALKAAEG